MDELVELEFVHLARVEAREAFTDVVEELAQFCPVVRVHEFTRGPAFGPLGCPVVTVGVFSHDRTVRQSAGTGAGPQTACGRAAVAAACWRLGAEAVMDEEYRAYPWVSAPDGRFTLALVTDVAEVLVRHGYPAPAGAVLVELTAGLFRALHAGSF